MHRGFVEEIDQLHAELCQALSDPKRILILYALEDGARSVGELAELIQVRQSNMSQHLAVLRDRGLVAAERSGTTVYYSLKYPGVVAALNQLREVLREKLADTATRAERLMENVK